MLCPLSYAPSCIDMRYRSLTLVKTPLTVSSQSPDASALLRPCDRSTAARWRRTLARPISRKDLCVLAIKLWVNLRFNGGSWVCIGLASRNHCFAATDCSGRDLSPNVVESSLSTDGAVAVTF